MSWSFKVVGKADDVKAAVLAVTNVPDSVKQVVSEVCDGITNSTQPVPSHTNGVYAEGAGHFAATDFWNNAYLKIEPIALAASTAIPKAESEQPPQPDESSTS